MTHAQLCSMQAPCCVWCRLARRNRGCLVQNAGITAWLVQNAGIAISLAQGSALDSANPLCAHPRNSHLVRKSSEHTAVLAAEEAMQAHQRTRTQHARSLCPSLHAHLHMHSTYILNVASVQEANQGPPQTHSFRALQFASTAPQVLKT